MKSSPVLSSLPSGVLAILAVLALAEVTLDVMALVSLARRPRSSVAFGNRWLWVAIIVLVNPVGGILYLAVGRKQVTLIEDLPGSASSGQSVRSIADALYGEHDDRDAP